MLYPAELPNRLNGGKGKAKIIIIQFLDKI